MSVGLYSHTTRATGTVLTAAIYNSDHTNHITNANPLMNGAYSDNLTQHQLNTDPGGLGSEILAGSLAVELEQLRFAIKRITGKTQWYVAPTNNLDTSYSIANISGLQAALDAKLSLAGGSLTGRLFTAPGVGQGNNAIGVVTASLGEVEIQSNGTGAATVAFHRAGNFAAYFGLDTDNKWKVGGWSMGAVAYPLRHDGNMLVSTAVPSGGADGDFWFEREA